MESKYKDKLTIYVDPETKQLIPKAKNLFSRESSSLSKFICQQIRQYVASHEPGNPQQRLDVICERGEAYRAPKLCLICGKVAEAEALFLSGLRGYVCGGCLVRKREQGVVRRVLRKI